MSRFRIEHQGLMTDVYTPESNGTADSAGLFLYGFPATLGENSATRELVTSGHVALQPQYPGTYDSAGVFSPPSAIQSIVTLAQALTSGTPVNLKTMRPARVPKKIRTCIGYSFGSFISLRAATFLPDIESLIMLSPAVLYSQGENKIFVEDGAEFIRYVSRTRPYTYRFDQTGIWPRFYSGELDVAQCHPHPHLRDVLGIVGSADKSFVLPELKLRFKEIVHSFVGSGVSVRLIEVEGAGHNASDLLTGEALVALRSLLRNQ